MEATEPIERTIPSRAFLVKTFMLVAVGVGLISLLDPQEAEIRKQEIVPHEAVVEGFAKAHRVTVPPELDSVMSGIYDGIEVLTPAGKQSCKASISSSAWSRQIVLSDCKPR